MNSRVAKLSLAVAGICISAAVTPKGRAENLHWSKGLSSDERNCLNELIGVSNSATIGSEELHKILAAAKVGRTDLSGRGREGFIYIIDDFAWCGTAGCELLIGERRANGVCHLLYNGDGSDKFAVLRRRDHGYRRLYTPCEARFDGREYHQVREQCPTLDVKR